MLRSLRAFSFLVFAGFTLTRSASSQQHLQPWQPTPGHTQVPIWPGTPPDAVKVDGPEYSVLADGKDLVAGRPWISAEHVSTPTITVYYPSGKRTDAAVIVFPGGGYQVLAMDLEGTEVCDWLTSRGILCVLLKYRVPGSAKFPKSGAYPKAPQALEDAQRTISLVRSHASDWKINPNKIGVIGFSAGGHLVAATSIHFAKRVYSPVDAIDTVSCRPDFAIAIYPGHLALDENSFRLVPDVQIHISAQTPTTFLLQNEDDEVDGVEQALSYYIGLKKAKIPVEMHLYAQGGHAFGLRRTKSPVTAWPGLVNIWLETIGMVP